MVHQSQISFDFTHDGNYDYQLLVDEITTALENLGNIYVLGVDFYSVDYPEYEEKGIPVSQCGVDIEWPEDHPYDEAEIEDALFDVMFLNANAELIGINFESLE